MKIPEMQSSLPKGSKQQGSRIRNPRPDVENSKDSKKTLPYC